MILHCHNITMTGYEQFCWPDGKSFLEQSQITVQVFDLIKREYAMHMMRKKK